MINSLEVYIDAGTKAGTAARRKDYRLVNHWNDWRNKAMWTETAEDGRAARKAYDEAYRRASGFYDPMTPA